MEDLKLKAQYTIAQPRMQSRARCQEGYQVTEVVESIVTNTNIERLFSKYFLITLFNSVSSTYELQILSI